MQEWTKWNIGRGGLYLEAGPAYFSAGTALGPRLAFTGEPPTRRIAGLGEDMAQVGYGRARGDIQALSDLSVGEPLSGKEGSRYARGARRDRRSEAAARLQDLQGEPSGCAARCHQPAQPKLSSRSATNCSARHVDAKTVRGISLELQQQPQAIPDGSEDLT